MVLLSFVKRLILEQDHTSSHLFFYFEAWIWAKIEDFMYDGVFTRR